MGTTSLHLPTFDELYAEIQALPEGSTGEILGPGELRVMARPGAPHRVLCRRLNHRLQGLDRMLGGEGWWIEREVELRPREDRLYVPDLCGWRVTEQPDFIYDNPIHVVPDWVCEILSRATQRADRVRKLPQYTAAGVGHVWILDPEARTVEVYETWGGRPALVATASDADTVVLPPFDLSLDLGALWLAPRG